MSTVYEGREFTYVESGNRATLRESGKPIWWGEVGHLPVDIVPRAVLLDLSLKRNQARTL